MKKLFALLLALSLVLTLSVQAASAEEGEVQWPATACTRWNTPLRSASAAENTGW